MTRADQDAFALESQRRAGAALAAGRFADEIVPVAVPQRKGDPVVVDADEHPRPECDPGTAGRAAPGLSDRRDRHGPAAHRASTTGRRPLLVTSRAAAEDLGLEPLARIGASAVAGVDPAQMGIGPVPATRKALSRAGLTIDDIDLVELNEAFAAQAIPCMRELGLDPERVNVNGGAIALGHPLGGTGAKLLTSLVHELRRRGGGTGLVTMCIGVGQGIATVVHV